MNSEQKDLIQYRLEQAEESILSARLLLGEGLLRPCVSRAYYAMFYSVLDLLVLTKSSTSKHSGVITMFDVNYILTGMLDKELSRWIHEAHLLRLRADYREMFKVSKVKATAVLNNATTFVTTIKHYLSELHNGKKE